MKVVGLRAKGGCPCARCLVSADSIPQMGTPGDREVRTVQKRADDDEKKQRVKKARDLIYGKKNYAVDSAKVEDLLKPTSLTPATVCMMCHKFTLHLTQAIVECLLPAPICAWTRYLRCPRVRHTSRSRDWRMEIALRTPSAVVRGGRRR
jgi:hypothetical protein